MSLYRWIREHRLGANVREQTLITTAKERKEREIIIFHIQKRHNIRTLFMVYYISGVQKNVPMYICVQLPRRIRYLSPEFNRPTQYVLFCIASSSRIKSVKNIALNNLPERIFYDL